MEPDVATVAEAVAVAQEAYRSLGRLACLADIDAGARA